MYLGSTVLCGLEFEVWDCASYGFISGRGLYSFARLDERALSVDHLYLGMTIDFETRHVASHHRIVDARLLGMNVLLIRQENWLSEAQLAKVEATLIDRLQPPLNVQHRCTAREVYELGPVRRLGAADYYANALGDAPPQPGEIRRLRSTLAQMLRER